MILVQTRLLTVTELVVIDVCMYFVVGLILDWKQLQFILFENKSVSYFQDLEAEVNVHYEDLINKDSRDQLLTNQVQRLLMCFDVYLETESDEAHEGPAEFGKEKVYPRVTR